MCSSFSLNLLEVGATIMYENKSRYLDSAPVSTIKQPGDLGSVLLPLCTLKSPYTFLDILMTGPTQTLYQNPWRWNRRGGIL